MKKKDIGLKKKNLSIFSFSNFLKKNLQQETIKDSAEFLKLCLISSKQGLIINVDLTIKRWKKKSTKLIVSYKTYQASIIQESFVNSMKNINYK